eukprot:2549878-Rhodomonas_salina.1
MWEGSSGRGGSEHWRIARPLEADRGCGGQVLDYEDPLFLKGAGMHAFDVILDCVGGDDYWQAFKGSLSHTGVYVTLVLRPTLLCVMCDPG